MSRVESKTMIQIIAGQFMEHRLGLLGAIVVVLFIVTALCAPVISKLSGHDPEAQNIYGRNLPPFSRVTLSQDAKEEALEKVLDANPVLVKKIIATFNKHKIITGGEDELFELLHTITPDQINQISNIDQEEAAKFRQIVGSFSKTHLLGTDELGRDLLIRLIYGTRVSIGIGIVVALAAMFIGLIIGSIAGYYGGVVDIVLSRIIDSLLSLPLLPLMIVLAAVDLKNIPFLHSLISGDNESIVKLFIILVLFSWMKVARLARGSILSIREHEFILAAKTLGAKDITIIITHIIPNIVAPLIVAISLNIGESILNEAALSFLGLGIQPPTPSWGNILFNALETINQNPILAIAPGILILLAVVSFNFIGDGLQDAIDPKAIKR